MTLESELKDEIRKWSLKLDEALKTTSPMSDKGSEFLANIKAYQKDSIYFFERKDLVRSFEALIWAWSWIEIGKEIDVLS